MRITFSGANDAPLISVVGQRSGIVNYVIGYDPKNLFSFVFTDINVSFGVTHKIPSITPFQQLGGGGETRMGILGTSFQRVQAI